MKYRLIIVVLIILALLGGGGWWLFGRNPSAVPAQSEPGTPNNGAEAGEAGGGGARSIPGPTAQQTVPEPIQNELRAHERPEAIPYYLPNGDADGLSSHTLSEYLTQIDGATTAPARAGGDAAIIPDAPAPGVSEPGADPDGDGLSNTQEAGQGTSPDRADTDEDGLSDGDEVRVRRTDPKRTDTDGDGLRDGEEVTRWNTDPLNPDTDGDTYPDGTEVKGGYNPRGSGKL